MSVKDYDNNCLTFLMTKNDSVRNQKFKFSSLNDVYLCEKDATVSSKILSKITQIKKKMKSTKLKFITNYQTLDCY
jgi:hypothetical protein